MLLRVTEECFTSEHEIGYREYEYLATGLTPEAAIKNFLFEFDTDRVINCNDLFEGECYSSELCKIEIIPYEEI
jgi:hypothetical protein